MVDLLAWFCCGDVRREGYEGGVLVLLRVVCYLELWCCLEGVTGVLYVCVI